MDIFESYITESTELLDAFEHGILDLESSTEAPAPEQLNNAFRAIHSIKGSANILGLIKTVDLTHCLETLLDRIRSGEIKPQKTHFNIILAAVDLLRRMIELPDQSEQVNIIESCNKLNDLLHKSTGDQQSSDTATPATGVALDLDSSPKPDKIKILIVEDDYMSRHILQEILSPHGDCEIVFNGKEAIQAFKIAWKENDPFDLICMDIMMPEVDGHEALIEIREMEKKLGVTQNKEVKVIMVSALSDPKNVFKAFSKGGATSFIVKPIEGPVLLDEIKKFGLL